MEKREKASQRERRLEIGSRATQITSHLSRITQITLITLDCFFYRGEKGGTVSNPFPESISALFVLCSIYFCYVTVAWLTTCLHGQGKASL